MQDVEDNATDHSGEDSFYSDHPSVQDLIDARNKPQKKRRNTLAMRPQKSIESLADEPSEEEEEEGTEEYDEEEEDTEAEEKKNR